MSLINKMLRDLEARQTLPGAPKQVYQDLNPVRSTRRSGAPRLLIVLLLVVAAAGAGFYFGLDEMLLGRQSAAPTPAPIATASKPAVPVTAPSEPANPPATAAVGVAPAAPTPSVPVEEKEAPASPVASAPSPTKIQATPAPATTQDINAHAQRSPAEAAPRIVKAVEPPPVTAPPRERKPAEVNAPPVKSAPIPASTEDSATVVEKKLRPLSAEENAEASYRQAVRLLDQGRTDEALRQLRGALAAHPKHIKARELAAGIELQIGHWREAEKLLEEGLRQVQNHYLFARMLARVYVDHGAEGKALAVMESAIPSGSDDAEFSALLGLLYQRAGRHADAVKAYERAVALQPKDGRTWLGFAISLEATEQWGAAKKAYRQAQTSDLPPSLARYAEQRLAALRDQ